MAIFIASTKSISRGKGQSAVASASYRAGVELEDKRYGKTHDYSKRHGVMSADIILPSALAAANADIDRADLWNKAEAAENRKDARVAREWLVNLPYELSEADRKAIAHKFAQTLADRYGTIADCAIHKPTDKEIARGADPRNFHAHIMFTTRTAALDANNKVILVDKATVELSDTKRRSLDLPRVSEEIKAVRLIWEQIANEKLLEHDHELIDSRSYAEQGIDILPQIKMGVDATHLERRTGEISIRGELNRLIAERNSLVWGAVLANNQRMNHAADQIIIKGHDIKRTTPPPTPESKRKTRSPADIAAAMAMAHGIRQQRADEQKSKDLVLEQQRLKSLAEQRQHEQALRERIEQQRLDRVRQQQRKQQAQAERLERDKKQFDKDKKQIYNTAFVKADNHSIKGIDKDKEAGIHILTLLVANDVIRDLKIYSDEPNTTLSQREFAKIECHTLIDIVSDKSKQALGVIKNLHYTDERKTYTAALQTALNDFVGTHSQTANEAQQKALQSLQRDVTNYSNEINRSQSYGMGR